MKVVFIKNSNFDNYKFSILNGYKFKPRNKFVSSLNIVNEDFIKYILSKKINREIDKAEKAIKLMLSSNITLESDCDIMIEELNRIAKKLEKKYFNYFNEFEYFDVVKRIYSLNMEIKLKKKLLSSI